MVVGIPNGSIYLVHFLASVYLSKTTFMYKVKYLVHCYLFLLMELGNSLIEGSKEHGRDSWVTAQKIIAFHMVFKYLVNFILCFALKE